MLILSLLLSLLHADTLYTDTWVNWSPAGKVYDIVCFSKRDPGTILKGVRVIQLNRKAFQFKDTDGELKAMPSKDCFFEQVDPHPVSRAEFFEEIVSVKCSLNSLPFKDGDFRILGTNVNITSIKRLRDGKVWILPTNDCTFTTQLEKKNMVEAKELNGNIPVNQEFGMLPGEIDQIRAGQGAGKKPEPIPKSADHPVETPAVKTEAGRATNTSIRTLLNQNNP